MPGGADFGRMLLILGGFLCLLGLLFLLSSKIPWLGRLPGDIHIQRGNWSCSFPLVTSLLLSLVLTVLLNLILRLWRK